MRIDQQRVPSSKRPRQSQLHLRENSLYAVSKLRYAWFNVPTKSNYRRIKTREKSGGRCLGEVLVYERFQL